MGVAARLAAASLFLGRWADLPLVCPRQGGPSLTSPKGLAGMRCVEKEMFFISPSVGDGRDVSLRGGGAWLRMSRRRPDGKAARIGFVVSKATTLVAPVLSMWVVRGGGGG